MLPFVDFPRVGGRVQRTWRPLDINPHQAAYGQSRAGKDHLWRYGVLPLKPLARTVVFDVKQGHPPGSCGTPGCAGLGDRTWCGWGTDIPLGDWRPDTAPLRTRLLVPLNVDVAEPLMRRALEALAVIGEHVIVLPDAGRITEHRQRGGLNCGGLVTRLVSEGASIGITVLAGLSSATWAESGLREQVGRVWLGYAMHADMRDAFAKAAGLPKEARPDLDQLAPRQFIYADHLDGAPMLAITTAPAAP